MPHRFPADDSGSVNAITVSEIQELVDRYFEYAQSKLPSGSQVYLSNVFEKDHLLRLLSEGADGIRIMLVKDADQPDDTQEQARIGMIAIPVKEESVSDGDKTTVRYQNLLGDENSVIYEACPSKYCESATQNKSLL